MFAPRMPGTRLEYVVVPLEGTLRREIARWTKKEGIVKSIEEVPAGYLVYFPRGHVIRIPNDEMLEHYGLDRDPKIISLAGLNDPESPLGKMMTAQDSAARAGAYQELEQQVMQLAIAKSGPVIMPEMVKRTRFVEFHDQYRNSDYEGETAAPTRQSRRNKKKTVEHATL